MAKPKLSYLVCVVVVIAELWSIGGSPVKFLPGFQGPLPFELETGYIGVGESEDVQLFYYFIKSESRPESDPVILWITGGPGCSALSGLTYEIGPVTFEPVEYNGSLPTMILNPYSWTKVASIIFLDLPVGTGFSYATTPAALQSSDLQASDHAYHFLGKGYLLGNPGTFEGQKNYEIPFAHGMGLISDELYESLKRNCKGEYVNVDPSNTNCLQDVETFHGLLERIYTAHILEPYCERVFFGQRRYLDEKFQLLNNSQLLPALKCIEDWYVHSYHWANNDLVREALHIRKGTTEEWVRCATLQFEKTVKSSIPYHANLSAKGYRSLIYSGDHDKIVPFQSTQAWIKSLNYSIASDWRPWTVANQVAGYTRTYSNQMTFATVKGGGHTAPEYKPSECLAMLTRWISHRPL